MLVVSVNRQEDDMEIRVEIMPSLYLCFLLLLLVPLYVM